MYSKVITYCHGCHKVIEPSKGHIIKGLIRATFNLGNNLFCKTVMKA